VPGVMPPRRFGYRRGVRAFPLDGGLLFFDRETGSNVLLDGEELAAMRQVAPRSVQFGITNLCNLACGFCSRDRAAKSGWTSDDAFTLLAELAEAGVLEVAFGGGEPFAFRGFEELVRRLYDETPLAVHVTTNGLLLDARRLRALRGKMGELRLSLYDDNDWRRTVSLLADEGVRFGVNLLVLPERLPALEAWVLELAHLGCRDVLLLSYNGADRDRHLSASEVEELASRVALLHRALGPRVRLSLDVCWGERMMAVPRFLDRRDCGAGRDFIVITSDKHLMPCSFHDVRLPIASASDVLAVWRERQGELGRASSIPGCARAPGFGMEASHARPRLERLRIQQ
jgi:MoaA/NifB/PqqE/SkfB family radical SAM enzyme